MQKMNATAYIERKNIFVDIFLFSTSKLIVYFVVLTLKNHFWPKKHFLLFLFSHQWANFLTILSAESSCDYHQDCIWYLQSLQQSKCFAIAWRWRWSNNRQTFVVNKYLYLDSQRDITCCCVSIDLSQVLQCTLWFCRQNNLK